MSEDRVADIVGAWREQVDKGEAPEPETLIRAHPDLAEQLRKRFAALSLLERKLGPPSPPPSTVGEYQILREIGRGGMGVVYEAVQSSMRRKVALKVLFPSVTSSPNAVKRFQQEAWAAGRLKHTNIVAVHQLGQDRGIWYCAMELVEGRPLSEVVADLARAKGSPRETGLARAALGRTPASNGSGRTTGARAYHARLAEMFAEVAEALQVAHEHGVVHRDVKPANLLLDAEGRMKLADFGLARLEEGAAGMTVTGEVLGTPLYMSPEQIAGGHGGVDARTDVYSLGATLYEALTLRPPFRGENVQQIASAILSRDPAPARRWDRAIPRDLETIVAKSMEKEPARRYRTAGEMATDLRLFAQGAAIRARRIGPFGRAWRTVRRQKVRSSLVAAALVLGGTALVAYLRAEAEVRRSRDLQYAILCGEAEEQRLASALGPETSATGALMASVAEDRTQEAYGRAIALDPERHEAYFGLALHSGRPVEQRLESLAQAEARGAPKRTVHLARALIHAAAGQLDRAREEERLAALSQAGGAQDARFEGQLLVLRAEYAEAERRLTDAVGAAKPGSSTRYMALYSRGLVRVRRRDYAGALEDFLCLQAVADRSVALQLRIASLWERLSHPDRAQAILDGLIQWATTSGSADLWVALCDGLSACDMRHCIDRVWQEMPSESMNCKAYSSRAAILNNLKRYTEALEAAERAVQLGGRHDPQSHYVRAYALLRLGRLDEARADAEAAVTLDPMHASAWGLLGMVHATRKDDGEALRCLGQAASLGYAWAHCGRGFVLRRQQPRRLEDELAAYDRAIELDPALADAHARRGTVLAKLVRLDEALIACERAIELDPSDALAHSNRGAVLHDRQA